MADDATIKAHRLGQRTRRSNPSGLLRFFPLGSPAAMSFYVLRGQGLSIGRAEDCSLHLPDSELSRHHARVVPRGDRWQIQDWGSTNGVFVDGVQTEQQALRGGEVIRCGTTFFRFLADGTSGSDEQYAVSAEGMVAGPSFERIRRLLDRAASSEINVLIMGETGTGKELAAAHLHQAGPRAAEALVPVNCAAIPAELFESEVFGHLKGAFSGATRDNPGLIRQAHKGTLLLDEIGELPLSAQPKLLRVIQERRVQPVGSARSVAVDARVVCATNRDLGRCVRDGTFRPDLYARVAGLVIALPPLRDRREDIPLLVQHFLHKHGHGQTAVMVEALEQLCCAPWPHNIRQLEAAVRRAVLLAGDGQELGPEHLEQDPTLDLPAAVDAEPAPRAHRPLGDAADNPQRTQLEQALRRHQGDTALAAQELGLSRSQVYRRAKQLGIKIASFRA